MTSLHELRGRVLGCWCASGACHCRLVVAESQFRLPNHERNFDPYRARCCSRPNGNSDSNRDRHPFWQERIPDQKKPVGRHLATTSKVAHLREQIESTDLFDILLMKPEDVKQIIAENQTLVNVGGHFFEGQTKHNRRSQGLPQMPDLIPFEAEGLIRRIHAFNGIGERYVSAFVSNAEVSHAATPAASNSETAQRGGVAPH